jgi:hypothetical protein
MTDDIAPSPRPLAARTRAERRSVTGALKVACDLIVHDGLYWDQAAVRAGLHVRTMRLAMKRPYVLQYLRQERDVLLASYVAQNPRRLAQLRDQDSNMAAAVRAAATLEMMHDSPTARGGSGVPTQPGLTIQIITRGDATTVGPVIEHDDREPDDR